MMEIAAVVPANNEERTIGGVVSALKRSGCFSQVVVVDDGSSDGTERAAREGGADMVVVLPRNVGKAGAMSVGVDHVSADKICFFDADLIGLTPGIVWNFVETVRSGIDLSAIGTVDRGFVLNLIAQVLPPVSGQRIVPRAEFERAAAVRKGIRYGIEVAINHECRLSGIRPRRVILTGVGQRTKFHKNNFRSALSASLEMWHEVVGLWFSLRFSNRQPSGDATGDRGHQAVRRK